MGDEMKRGIIEDMLIEVKEGEIALVPGDFYAMRKDGGFTKSWEDPDDILKLCGIGKDGRTYVTEKDGMTLTDEEDAEWGRRYKARFGDVMLDEDGEPLVTVLTAEEAAEYKKECARYERWDPKCGRTGRDSE